MVEEGRFNVWGLVVEAMIRLEVVWESLWDFMRIEAASTFPLEARRASRAALRERLGWSESRMASEISVSSDVDDDSVSGEGLNFVRAISSIRLRFGVGGDMLGEVVMELMKSRCGTAGRVSRNHVTLHSSPHKTEVL